MKWHHQYLPDTLFIEPDALDEVTIHALQKRGHQVKRADDHWGNMQAIFWNSKTGHIEAASDPRVEGSALVQ